jgi:tRNA pseudouridine55 synthase
MQGFLNLNKPPAFTSHDCVAKVRKLLRLKRVGHAGTLDPAATGVLPIALGAATRLLQFLPTDKAYQATIRLGQTTTTDDLEGETLSLQPVAQLELSQIQEALLKFQGTIQQIPPIYSAIQVQGQRLYKMARTGQEITVPTRQVEIYETQILAWRPGDFPEVDVTISCGTGTYIRAIARDLGQILGTGGVLTQLTRTLSSGFTVADSLTFSDLDAQIQQGVWRAIAPELALAHLPDIRLPRELARHWCQGQRIAGEPAYVSDYVRVQDSEGHFLGVGELKTVETQLETQLWIAPRVVIASP